MFNTKETSLKVAEFLLQIKAIKLQPQKPFTKMVQPPTVEAEDSQFVALGEKPKWSRPGHKIERNVEASVKGK